MTIVYFLVGTIFDKQEEDITRRTGLIQTMTIVKVNMFSVELDIDL